MQKVKIKKQLKEAPEDQRMLKLTGPATVTQKVSFEEDPMNYILLKYPSLHQALNILMTDAFKDYVNDIYVVAPRPTTFKIVLHNNQEFFLIFTGKTYICKVEGKKYYLSFLSDKQRASKAIAQLLELGAPIGKPGPSAEDDGAPKGPEDEAGLEGEEETTPEEGGEEETLEEGVKKKAKFRILKESPESDILSIFKSDKTAASLGPEKVVPSKGGYRVYFSGINSRDTSTRKDVLKNLKGKDGVKIKYSPDSRLSSVGSVKITVGKNTYEVTAKGTSKTATSTNVKEGLVILFYESKVKSPISEKNFEDVVVELGELVGTSEGIDENTSAELTEYLKNITTSSTDISTLNQSLSQALTIKKAYSKNKLTRTGIFTEYRSLANNKLGLPADKWCPGDVYVVIDEARARQILEAASEHDNGSMAAETLNEAFNEEWGNTKNPLTAVSLKFEKAQGGKAKAYFDKFRKAKTEYNLSADEQKYKEEQYRQGITRLREAIISKTKTNSNIKYNLTDPNVKNISKDKLKGKYAALKALNFFFSQLDSEDIDEGLLSLAAFAMSLSDVSPAFFKVIANSKGTEGTVEPFERGTALALAMDREGNPDPIDIEDKPTFGGLEIKMKISKGGESELVSISARNNGTTQGTIEISKITKLAENRIFRITKKKKLLVSK